MTLIMVCVSTRPTVQRETIVRLTGDVKAETVDDDCSRQCKKNVAQALEERCCAGDIGEVDGEAHRRVSRAYKRSPSSKPRRSRLPQCPSRARTKDVSQEGDLCNAFPDHIAHPAVAELGAGAGRVDHGLDQQVADENSVRH